MTGRPTHIHHRSGRSQTQCYGANPISFAVMPVGTYHVETGPGGGSILFRFSPLIQRPLIRPPKLPRYSAR